MHFALRTLAAICALTPMHGDTARGHGLEKERD